MRICPYIKENIFRRNGDLFCKHNCLYGKKEINIQELLNYKKSKRDLENLSLV